MSNPTMNKPDRSTELVRRAVWTLNQGDASGSEIGADWMDYGDKCVQVTGTFGAGTFVWQGSNDGVNWGTLNAAGSGTAISLTSAGVRQVIENPLFMRPAVTGADGTTALTVTLVAKRATLGRD